MSAIGSEQRVRKIVSGRLGVNLSQFAADARIFENLGPISSTW